MVCKLAALEMAVVRFWEFSDRRHNKIAAISDRPRAWNPHTAEDALDGLPKKPKKSRQDDDRMVNVATSAVAAVSWRTLSTLTHDPLHSTSATFIIVPEFADGHNLFTVGSTKTRLSTPRPHYALIGQRFNAARFPSIPKRAVETAPRQRSCTASQYKPLSTEDISGPP